MHISKTKNRWTRLLARYYPLVAISTKSRDRMLFFVGNHNIASHASTGNFYTALRCIHGLPDNKNITA